jgi:hypothetical protein
MTFQQFLAAPAVFLWAKGRRYCGPYRTRRTKMED